jgi:hypothetical protein
MISNAFLYFENIFLLNSISSSKLRLTNLLKSETLLIFVLY